jgi:hypothetical protein
MTIKKDFRERVVKPYKKRKKILDLNILEKYKINKKYLVVLILSIFLFTYNKRFFTFVAVTLFSAIFTFYHSKFNRSPMDFKLALFLGVFITKYYGLHFTFVFFILSDIVPQLLGGESLNGPDLFFIGLYFIVNSLVYLFPNVSLVILGPILVIVEAFGSFFINSKIGGIPGFMSFFLSILTILVRIIYFLILGNVLEIFFKTIM